MIPFNNFGVVKDAYEFYQKLGACYVMDQCNHDSGIPCFSSLRIYTYSKLLYEPDLDYNSLVDDFSRHYYGEASNEFLEYFYFAIFLAQFFYCLPYKILPLICVQNTYFYHKK